MKRFLVIAAMIAMFASLMVETASAEVWRNRPAGQVYRPNPGQVFRPNPGQVFRANPGFNPGQVGRPAGPMFHNNPTGRPGRVDEAGLGPHGHPMFQGPRGFHEFRNWTTYTSIPGIPDVGDDDPQGNFESFVDSIDVSQSLDAIPACTEQCNLFGAMSIANDGMAGWAWNSSSPQDAVNIAANGCASRATLPCGTTTYAVGTDWLAGIYCNDGARVWGGLGAGFDAPSAMTNAYRVAAQQLGFSPESCSVVGLVAANGAQQNVDAPQGD
jgi:hypothetical protein